MASSGGWLFISFMFLILALSLRTSSSLRCERGLGNCDDDEIAISRPLKKRAKNCRFGCIGGGKRETEEKKPFKIPENEKQTADELTDEILQKRESDQKKKQKTPRPSCGRFFCAGRKRSVEPPKTEFNTANEVVTEGNPSALVECLRFGGCKRTPGKETFSSPKKPEKSEKEHQEEQDSQPDCLGCKKREQTRLPVAPNEETQESFPPVDQNDTQKPRCWRFGCGKRSTPLQTLVKIISKRFYQKPSQLKHFDQGDQESKNSMTEDN